MKPYTFKISNAFHITFVNNNDNAIRQDILLPYFTGIVIILFILSPYLSLMSNNNSFVNEPKNINRDAISNKFMLFIICPRLEPNPAKYIENATKYAHDIFFNIIIFFKYGVYNKTFNNARCKYFCWTEGNHIYAEYSIATVIKDAYPIASFTFISPVTNGREGLLYLSTSKSKMSFIIMLTYMTSIVFIELSINVGEESKLCNEGVVIHPPEKHNNNVGKVFPTRINFAMFPIFCMILFLASCIGLFGKIGFS